MKPFCSDCITQMPFITDCKLCPKFEAIKERHIRLARYNAQLEKKLLLAAKLIEYHVQQDIAKDKIRVV